MTSRQDCARRDEGDSLARFREEFLLPEGVIYLDGNSLGALSRSAQSRVHRLVDQEWGGGLVASWNTAKWYTMPQRLGARIARLVGAAAEQVVVCDNTSVNLYKALVAATRLRPARQVVVADAGEFPTDLYIIAGAGSTNGAGSTRLVGRDGATLSEVLDEDVSVVVLSHVDYRTGRLRDMAAITAQVHEAGSLVLWDLAHSAGVVEVALDASEVDFAVGCTYKYLNGGPGSPAYLYAAFRHHNGANQPLSGWFGHASPFAFSPTFEPAAGISRFLTGTPPMIALAALDGALEIWDELEIGQVRQKSVALTRLFIEQVEARCGRRGVTVASPCEPGDRGSQVSLRHPDGYPIVQALIERGVIGDFRYPNVLRFGFAPLYLRFVDVWDAVEVLAEVLASEAWREDQYLVRTVVT